MIIIKNKRFLGSFFCITAAIVWGLSFVAQSSGKGIGTFTFNGIRTVMGGIVLLPFVFVALRKEKKTSGDPSYKYPIKDIAVGGLCCGLALFAGGNLQQHAFNYLYAGKVGFLTALYMILVPVFGLFLKKKVRFNVWLGVALGAVGLYFLCIKKGDLSLGKGELITLICAFCFAIHILVVDYFCTRVNNVALSCAQFLVAGGISVVCMFIFEEPKINEIMGASLELLYAGIMSCGVAFTFQIFGQKYAEPAVASLLLCLESVFSVIFSWLLLDQQLSARELCGCVIMFTAIIFTQIPSEKFVFKKKIRQ